MERLNIGAISVQHYGDAFAGKDTADHFTGGAFVIDTAKEGTQSVDRGDMMLADGKVGAVPRYGKGHEGKDTEDNMLDHALAQPAEARVFLWFVLVRGGRPAERVL